MHDHNHISTFMFVIMSFCYWVVFGSDNNLRIILNTVGTDLCAENSNTLLFLVGRRPPDN